MSLIKYMVCYFTGGNSKVAAYSTAKIYKQGLSKYRNEEYAYRYLYLYKSNMASMYVKHDRDFVVIDLYQTGKMRNCTDISVGQLNMDAAPKDIHMNQTYLDFSEEIAKYLRKFGIPERYITGDNQDLVSDIKRFLQNDNFIVPKEKFDALIRRIITV